MVYRYRMGAIFHSMPINLPRYVLDIWVPKLGETVSMPCEAELRSAEASRRLGALDLQLGGEM